MLRVIHDSHTLFTLCDQNEVKSNVNLGEKHVNGSLALQFATSYTITIIRSSPAQDGALEWYEYVMFRRPSDFALTHTQVSGKHSAVFDEDGNRR